MRRILTAIFLLLVVLSTCLPLSAAQVLAAPTFASPLFSDAWNRADRPVEAGAAGGRGWTWGPNVFGPTTIEEYYADAPKGKRVVQYFDKARMEVAYQDNSTDNPAYLTTGLLVNELVTGLRQEGDKNFAVRAPAQIAVAGDGADFNPNAPTYASFGAVIRNSSANLTGQSVKEAINKKGEVAPITAPTEVKLGFFEPATQHNIASVFITFENTIGPIWDGAKFVSGPVYTENPTVNVFGYPVTEPYWSKVKVGGVEKDVLIQLFQRRVLTYTPSNPAAYQVEMGNLGQHYYIWRYQTTPPVVVTNLSGSGVQTTRQFFANQGIVRAKVNFTPTNNNDSHSFRVKLLDSNGKDYGEILSSDKAFVGTTYLYMPATANYVFSIQSDGNWSFDITDYSTIEGEKAVVPSGTISGNGNTGTQKLRLEKGIYNVKVSYKGTAPISISVLGWTPLDDYSEKGILSQDTAFEGTVALGVEYTGDYFVNITSDGDWSLQFTKQ